MEAIGHEDQWLAQRRQSRGCCSLVRQIPDGRSFQVNERRMKTGGIIAVWTDITCRSQNDHAPDNITLMRALVEVNRRSPYDPDHLMAEAHRWREIAEAAPISQRDIFLDRAWEFETMVIRSLTLASVTN